jgi:hypothetical protein
LYFKSRRARVPLHSSTWAGSTVAKLYYKTKIQMNQREKSYVSRTVSLRGGHIAEGDEIGLEGNALGDFYMKQGFEGFKFAGIGHG